MPSAPKTPPHLPNTRPSGRAARGCALAVCALIALACAAASAQPREHGTRPIPRKLYQSPDDLAFRALVSSDLGLHVTEDDGERWFWICEDIIGYDVQDFALLGPADAAPANRAWVAVGIGVTQDNPPQAVPGIYRSTDGGCNWSSPAGPLADQWGVALSPHPTRHDEALVATAHPGLPNGVGQTTDGGATWAWTSLRDLPGILNGLVRAPSDPEVVYASTSHFSGQRLPRQLHRSTDGGATWALLLDADERGILSLDTDRMEIHAVDPGDPSAVYLSATTPRGRDLYVLQPDGSPRLLLSTNTQEFSALVVVPTGDDGLGRRIIAGNIFGDLYISDDLGQSWREDTIGDPIECLAADLADPQSLYLCSNIFVQFTPVRYALGKTDLDVSAITRAFHYQDIAGHRVCPDDSQVNTVCIPLDNPDLPGGPDAGSPGQDAGADADSDDAGDDAGDDASASPDAPPSDAGTPPASAPPPDDCGCRLASPRPSSPLSPWSGLALSLLAALIARARRRAGRT